MLVGLLLAGAWHAAAAASPRDTVPSAPVAAVEDAPPSDRSLHELLAITQKQSQLDAMRAQLDGYFRDSLDEAFREGAEGRTLSKQQQAILDGMRVKLTAIMEAQLSWETLEPIFVRIYRASFTQAEVDDLTAFYRSPAGQALLTKMPRVLQNTLTEMTGIMLSIQQQVNQVREETVREMQNLPTAPPTNTG
jgi:hypothetical protein